MRKMAITMARLPSLSVHTTTATLPYELCLQTKVLYYAVGSQDQTKSVYTCVMVAAQTTHMHVVSGRKTYTNLGNMHQLFLVMPSTSLVSKCGPD
jgi:hypothetical protein